VRLFLEGALGLSQAFAGLELHLPCRFEFDAKAPLAAAFAQSGKSNDPGKTLNALHRAFALACHREHRAAATFVDIACAIALGASLAVHDGFLQRNAAVARAPRLLAWYALAATLPSFFLALVLGMH
jgi:hypothetical protein